MESGRGSRCVTLSPSAHVPRLLKKLAAIVVIPRLPWRAFMLLQYPEVAWHIRTLVELLLPASKWFAKEYADD